MPDDNTTERPTRPTRCSPTSSALKCSPTREQIRQTPALPHSLCSLCGGPPLRSQHRVDLGRGGQAVKKECGA